MKEEPKDIKTIFSEALEKKDARERAAYLDKVCGNDVDLRAKVEELLMAHEEAGDFLKVPALGQDVTFESSPVTEGPGTRIGHYELLELIGEGGMGLVYLAEQKEPVKRRLALKIVKPGMDTKQVIARFEAEKQMLALLDHPNIARVYDAGTTETGRPYFVMEYVKGLPITEYCDQRKSSIEERLKLFRQVCEGVQHAHQKGIIHRDIKPSNILVTVEGDRAVPKIIDFGIAKAIAQPLTDKTFVTFQGQLLGTPEYMSPEQVDLATQDIDIRSDIYSLGVVLYELLAGALPFERECFEKGGFAQIQQVIREQEPASPSVRLTSLGEKAKTVAASRSTQVIPLARRLHRELEWIPLKAMRKDRCRRYRSASELADDVRNYLNGLPLIAGPETAVYLVKKFVRRHAGSVATVALVTAAIVAGLVVSTTMYFQAEQAREKESAARTEAERQAMISQAVNEFLNNDLLASFDPYIAKGHEVTVIEVLDNAAEKLEGKFKDAPSIEASIRDTLGTTYMNLGKYKAAEPHLKRVLELRRGQFGGEHPDTLKSMADIGVLYERQGRYNEAEPLLVKALEIQRRVLGEEHPDTLWSMRNLGWPYSRQGRYKEAEPLLVKAMEISRRVLGEEHSETLWTMDNLGWLYCNQGRYNEAEPLFVKMLEISRRVLGEEHPATLHFMSSLGELYSIQSRYNEAEPLLVKALEGNRRVLGEEHIDTMWSMSNLGRLYSRQGHYNEAEPLWAKALEISRRVLGEENPETLNFMCNLGDLYSRQGRYKEAEPLFVKALEIRRRVLGEEHKDTLWAMNNLGWFYITQGRYKEAELLYVKGLETRRRVKGEENPDTLNSMNSLGWLYTYQGRYKEAEPLLVKALETQQRVLGKEHPDTLYSMMRLVWFYGEQVRNDEAKLMFDKSLEIGNSALSKGDPNVLNSIAYSLNRIAWEQAASQTAELRNGAKAIEYATKACELMKWQSANYVDTLAAAYAEAGDFDSAVKWQKKAIDLLTGKEPAGWKSGFEDRLRQYQSGKPCRGP